MQRYFIPADVLNGSHVRLTGDEVHHIRNVMRNRPGDRIIVCFEDGYDYVCEIQDLNHHQIDCIVVEKFPSQGEPQTKITIAQSLVKGDKLEWIVQKGTEIGASSFQPFHSARSIVKINAPKEMKKRERWQRIAKEAAEQSHRGKVPAVLPVLPWNAILDKIEKFPLSLIAYEKGGIPINQAMAGSQADEILLLIGPEGGFTEDEVNGAHAKGAIPITLGPRILRTETAPLVALSCMLFYRNELGGE
ncbi:16S rRNA (uracil(1498)-N(3))-methyltransferase [Thermoactinomyces mirandus]|uniref:Ribosomal RNA small subunit methyltransferase E n=1 Tax=Thermoactinomyces mirandus TaxID=2756294 RepID=A0A7W1XPI3_9BACL|nr:16S rRNA (uracil(1498)-N(3))-methyltransferase [Thermoactinomyces mirandus]MBA4600767.1 16S rRNA (uracil(1498)-N(3))-methyltransferase [Thermoactinomyces mirandus]